MPCCRGRSLRRTLAGLLLAGPLLAGSMASGATAASAASGYQLGQGVELGPVNLSGYASLTASLPDQGRKGLAVEDLSLFVSARIAALVNPFVEAELTDLDLAGWGRDDRGRDGYAVLERAYNDANLPGGFTVRLGKMLAPVGQWNEIHAAPLVLSVVRPAVTHRHFSEYVTGVSVLYADPAGHLSDLQVYWQPTEELSARPDSLVDSHYRQVEGGHLSLPLALLDRIGASFQRTVDMAGVDQLLYGIDGHYTIGRLTLQGELSYLTLRGVPAGQRRHEWGGYLAPSYALGAHWSLHSWYEAYAGRQQSAAAQDLLVGVAYRPEPGMVFKLDAVGNIGGRPVNPTGIFASWSVLF